MTRSPDAVGYQSPRMSTEGVGVLAVLGVLILWVGIYPTPLVAAVRALIVG